MTPSPAIREVSCDSIRVVSRHRREMGDLEALANSISTVGLLHPPVITEDGVLICGERRLRAMRDILGWPLIPVAVLQVSSIVEGEYAENEIRKDFTPSERVEIGKALEAEIGNRQGQRTDRLPQYFAEVQGKETREIAAKKAGFGNRTTYEQAKKVVERAVPEVVAQMDTGDLAISAASLVADQPPDRQREIAQLPEGDRKAAVRKLRHRMQRMGLPTPGVYREKASEIAARTIVDAAREISACKRSAAEIAASIHNLDMPGRDVREQIRKAAAFLEEINQVLKTYEGKDAETDYLIETGQSTDAREMQPRMKQNGRCGKHRP